MARKPKIGLDYFPLEVDFLDDTKIAQLLVSHGHIGILVYIRFLCRVYKEGYFIEATIEELSEAISLELHISNKKLKETIYKVLISMKEMNLIDSLTYEFYKVITSKSIQKQFLASTIRRKKQEEYPYWLLSADEVDNITRYFRAKANESNNEINVDRNQNEEKLMSPKTPLLQTETQLMSPETPFLSTEVHKVKVKEKVKKKEDKEDKFDKRNCPFHLDYFTSCLINDHLIDVYDINIARFVDLFTTLLEENDFSLVERCFRYTRDYVRKNKDTIYDLYSFFSAALKENVRKMDGYEERMEKLYEEWSRILAAVRRNSEDE